MPLTFSLRTQIRTVGTKHIDVSRYAKGAYLLKANSTAQKVVIIIREPEITNKKLKPLYYETSPAFIISLFSVNQCQHLCAGSHWYANP